MVKPVEAVSLKELFTREDIKVYGSFIAQPHTGAYAISIDTTFIEIPFKVRQKALQEWIKALQNVLTSMEAFQKTTN